MPANDTPPAATEAAKNVRRDALNPSRFCVMAYCIHRLPSVDQTSAPDRQLHESFQKMARSSTIERGYRARVPGRALLRANRRRVAVARRRLRALADHRVCGVPSDMLGRVSGNLCGAAALSYVAGSVLLVLRRSPRPAARE
jgi:hypothetical protein